MFLFGFGSVLGFFFAICFTPRRNTNNNNQIEQRLYLCWVERARKINTFSATLSNLLLKEDGPVGVVLWWLQATCHESIQREISGEHYWTAPKGGKSGPNKSQTTWLKQLSAF